MTSSFSWRCERAGFHYVRVLMAPPSIDETDEAKLDAALEKAMAAASAEIRVQVKRLR